MARNAGTRNTTGQGVVDAALDRIRYAFDVSDHQVVLFSGGKDSTVLLYLVLHVARERKRTPLPVLFVDEEAIPPETVEYMERVRNWPDVRLTWSCVPVKHRNACSRTQPWWLTWNPDERALWCRERPAGAVTGEDRADIPAVGIAEQMGYWCPSRLGTVCQFLGRRTQESLTRYRMIVHRRGFEAFMSGGSMEQWKHIRTADPIYDFTAEDVWLSVHENRWDYNRTYDLYCKLGLPLSKMRLAPPYGEEPSRDLWMFKRAWPHLWDKMQARVDGADCAARYSRTELYQMGTALKPAEGETWREFTQRLLLRWPDEQRGKVAANVAILIARHRSMCIRQIGHVPEIPDTTKHEVSGISWRILSQVAGRGVLKGRTLSQAIGGTDRKKRVRAKH